MTREEKNNLESHKSSISVVDGTNYLAFGDKLHPDSYEQTVMVLLSWWVFSCRI